MTPQEELELINLSISNVLTAGQQFNMSSGGAGRGTTFASLDSLYARKRELEAILGQHKATQFRAGW